MKFYYSQICPPYNTDWYCTDENYDGAPDGGGIVGIGTTKLDALEDYVNQLEEWNDSIKEKE